MALAGAGLIMTNLDRYRGELYTDRKREWRWRLLARRNGKIVATSGEGYRRRVDCLRMFVKLFPFVALKES